MTKILHICNTKLSDLPNKSCIFILIYIYLTSYPSLLNDANTILGLEYALLVTHVQWTTNIMSTSNIEIVTILLMFDPTPSPLLLSLFNEAIIGGFFLLFPEPEIDDCNKIKKSHLVLCNNKPLVFFEYSTPIKKLQSYLLLLYYNIYKH